MEKSHEDIINLVGFYYGIIFLELHLGCDLENMFRQNNTNFANAQSVYAAKVS